MASHAWGMHGPLCSGPLDLEKPFSNFKLFQTSNLIYQCFIKEGDIKGKALQPLEIAINNIFFSS